MSGVLNVLLGSAPLQQYAATLNNATYGSSVVAPDEAYAGIRIGSDGYVYSYSTEGGWMQEYQWLTGDGDAGDYQAWQDTTPSGNVGAGSSPSETWISCASDPFWWAFRSTVGSTTSYYLIKVRMAASPNTELAFCNLTLPTTVI